MFLSCKMSTSILPGVWPRAKYWESGIRQTCPSQFQWSFSESYACDGIGVIWKGFHARWLPQQKEVVWVVPLDVDSRRTGEASPESTSLAQRRHTQRSPKSKARTLRTPTDSYSSVAKNQTTQLKMHKTWKRHFSKEDRHLANGYRKRCLTLLILQLKIAVNYCCISLKMAIIRKQKNNKFWLRQGERELLNIVDGCSCYENLYGSSSKNRK